MAKKHEEQKTMPEKKRYLVGYRHGATVPRDVESLVETFVADREAVQHVRKLKGGKRVVQMTPEQAAELAGKQPDLVIEEDEELELFSPMPGLLPRVPTEVTATLQVKVLDNVGEKPVENATVYCQGQQVMYQGKTGPDGVAQVAVSENALQRMMVVPLSGFWSRIVPVAEVKDGASHEVRLDRLSLDGSYTWGAESLAVDRIKGMFTGRGVKIAVIDSGIAPHEDLKVAGGFDTLDGDEPGGWNVDEKGHGTHCTGVIGAQLNDLGIRGVAPEAEIYGLKIFPGGRFSDLIEAVDWCIENYMDVISMSLGSPTPSAQLEQALGEAYQRGITCIAAAGNNSGAVAYPAAFDHVIAVAAVGKRGSFPDDSSHSLRESEFLAQDGEHFIASFSNFGPKIDIAAPGLAVASTVPTGYAAWDGTSMACPHIAAVAALILEAYPELRTCDAYQPYYLREILLQAATDLGLPPERQGAGLANAYAALATACAEREQEEAELANCREYLQEMLGRAQRCASDLETSLLRLEAL